MPVCDGRHPPALDLFHTEPGAVDPARLRIGQALADFATIGLLQQRAIARRGTPTAFALLRHQTRSTNRRISDVAQAVVDGSEQLPTKLC